MTNQDAPTIASVKQSMQRHIYDLNDSLGIARAAAEGLLPEAYNVQEDAIKLMIGQAYELSDKLLSDLESMDVLEEKEQARTQGAAIEFADALPEEVQP